MNKLLEKCLAVDGKAASGLLFSSLALLLLVTAGSDLLCFETLKKVRHAGISFDSRSPDKALAAYKELGGETPGALYDLSVRFRMKVYSVGGWNNVFQTAPGNSGIRLELGKPFTAGLVWGCGRNKGVCGVVAHPAVEPGKWYTVAVFLDKHKRLKVLFDGETVYREEDRTLSVDLSDIAVGTGYGKTRNFDGAIKDFTLQYGFFRERRLAASMLPALRGLAAVCFAACLALWALRRRAGSGARRFRPADLLHPALMAVFPALFLFSVNLNEASPADLAVPLGVSLAAASALALAGYFVLRDSAKAAVITTVALTGVFSAGRLFWFLADAGVRLAPADFRAAAAVGLCILSGAVFFSKIDYGKATPFLNMFAGILVGLSVLTIGGHYARRSILYPGGEEKTAAPSPAAGPDIYYIILDAYASQAVLKEYYSYDNSGFAAYLTEKDFYVPSETRSNYRATLLSIPSALNMRYLDGLGPAALPGLFNRNAAARFLKSRGYKFIVLNLPGVISPYNDYADLRVGYGSFPQFWVLLLKTTLFFGLADDFNDLERAKTLAFFAKLPRLAALPGPKFVYAYVMCPHHPYLFGAGGEPVEKAMRDNILIGRKNAVANKRSYVNQLRFVTGKIRESIDGILAASAREPVIILQSDHGPALYDTPAMAKGVIPGRDYLQARFQILNAYHLPGGSAGLYDSITPVNTFRVVLNRYFQAGLPLLPDKNYYSPDSDLFSFTDVTARVKAGPR